MKRLELFFTFMLVPLDAAMVLLAFVIAFFSRSHLDSSPFLSDFGLVEYIRYAFYLLPVWIFLFASNGLYAIKKNIGILAELYHVVIANSIAILLLIVALFLSQSFFYSRLILMFTWIASVILVYFGRVVLKIIRVYLFSRGVGQRNVLIIGSNDTSHDLALQIISNRSWGYRIAGVVAEENKATPELKILGDVENLTEILKKNCIDEVILVDFMLNRRKMVEIVEICDNNKISFKYVPDIYSMVDTNFRQGLLGSIPVMELNSIPLDGWGRIVKRICDILFSGILLVILSPFFFLVALIIKFTSRGPVFFYHTRIGRDERKFKFFKFRSMYTEKCDWKEGGVWTTANDEKTRITPFGRVLRKTNFDELPQLLNIFIGDMSFIGPRPEQPTLVDKFENDMPEYFRRHKVKSGLTGWAQVNGLKGNTSVKERVKYDIYYIENWSLWLDAKILLKTVWLIVYETINGKLEYRTRP